MAPPLIQSRYSRGLANLKGIEVAEGPQSEALFLMINRAKPAQKIKNFRNSARSSILPCSLGLTGHDPQRGTVMKAL